MDFLDLLMKILLVLTGIGAVIIFIWILVGDSPTITDFLAGTVTGIVMYLVHLSFHQGKFEGKVITSFSYLREDINEIKLDLRDLKEKITAIERRTMRH